MYFSQPYAGPCRQTGKILLIIAFVGSRTHGRGTFPSPEKYPKGRRGIPPVPQFTGVSNRILLNLQLLCRLIRFLSSNLQRVYRRYFGLRPCERDRCFYRCLSEHVSCNAPAGVSIGIQNRPLLMRGIPKGALPPLCRRGRGGHGGETPSKGFLLPCVLLPTFPTREK